MLLVIQLRVEKAQCSSKLLSQFNKRMYSTSQDESFSYCNFYISVAMWVEAYIRLQNPNKKQKTKVNGVK